MLNKTRQFWRVFFRRFLCNHNFISRETEVNLVRRRNARGGISRTVSVYLDEDTNNRLIKAKDRSGRSKTIEVQIRISMKIQTTDLLRPKIVVEEVKR
ncbi:TraY domain-containing protein (plasmid) [Escherichia coli]